MFIAPGNEGRVHHAVLYECPEAELLFQMRDNGELVDEGILPNKPIHRACPAFGGYWGVAEECVGRKTLWAWGKMKNYIKKKTPVGFFFPLLFFFVLLYSSLTVVFFPLVCGDGFFFFN